MKIFFGNFGGTMNFFHRLTVVICVTLISATLWAAEEPLSLSWDDSNTLTDISHFNIYVCDQPVPDTVPDEHGAAIDPVTCPGTLQTYTVPYAVGTTTADIKYQLQFSKGTLHIRADVERSNGIRSLLSNQINHTFDYQVPRTITIHMNLK